MLDNKNIIYDIQKELYDKSVMKMDFHKLYEKVLEEKNILYAISRISSNSGRNTSGENGKTFEELMKLPHDEVVNIVKQELTKPKKQRIARQVLIPKPNGKKRPLGITNIEERIAQQCVLNILESILEPQFNKNSFGFRRNLGAKECVSKIALNFKVRDGKKYVFDCDLKNYFGTVKIDNVLNLLRTNHNIKDGRFLKLIKELMWLDTKANRKILKYNGTGLAQGTILGPILANVQLNDFELELEKVQASKSVKERIAIRARELEISKPDEYLEFRKRYEEWHGTYDITMFRYADDFILVSSSQYDLNVGINMFREWCSKYGLEINENKTQILSGETIKLDFLGYTIRSGGKNFFISIKDYAEFKARFNNNIKKYLRAGDIDMLNATINGTFYYYDITTNLSNLCKIVGKTVHRYEHRRSSFTKVKKIQGHDAYRISNSKGKSSVIDVWTLRRETKKSVKYYMKNIKYWKPVEENSYHTVRWIEEFIDGHKPYLNGRLMSYVLSKIRQQKKEPVLQIPLININPSEIHVHHKKPLSQGGKDEYANIVLIHKRVHVALHSNKDCEPSWYKPNYNKLKKIIHANE